MAHQRIQLRFCKEGDLRFLGHRDILRTFERLFRRAGLKMRMTEGFHPHAKMSFPLALAVGIAGEDEVVEIEIDEAMSMDEVLERLRGACPTGLDFISAMELPAGSKNAPVESVVLELNIPADRQAELRTRIDELLAVEERNIVRKGRREPINLRPLVESLTIEDGRLRAKMRISSQVSVRPRELLIELGIEDLESDGYPLTRTRVDLKT